MPTTNHPLGTSTLDSLPAMGNKAPSWPHMLGRMAAVGARTATGALHFRDPGTPADPGIPERVDPREGACRFRYAAPDRWRVEDERGAWHVQDDHWVHLLDEHGLMQRMPNDAMIVALPLEHPQTLIGHPRERNERFTRDDDFSVPVGPGVATRVAGRDAWEFVLAPPRRKPHPLHVVVDDATGIVLRMAVPEMGFLVEMTELHIDVELDAGVFTWTGPVATDRYDDLVGHRRAQTWLEQERIRCPAGGRTGWATRRHPATRRPGRSASN